MHPKLIATFVAACAAAGLYHWYNLNEFKKYSAKKLKDDQEAKQKMEYRKFITERRQKRLQTLERWVIHIACFLAGYLYGGAECEFNHMRLQDGAI